MPCHALHQGLVTEQYTFLDQSRVTTKAAAVHVGYRECGEVMQNQVMTVQDQIQTSSRPNPIYTQNFGNRARASSTAKEPYRVAGCGVVVLCGSVADRVVGVGGTCTPARLELSPSPQIELGALTSANNLTRRQRCNPNLIRIDPVMEMQAYY